MEDLTEKPSAQIHLCTWLNYRSHKAFPLSDLALFQQQISVYLVRLEIDILQFHVLEGFFQLLDSVKKYLYASCTGINLHDFSRDLVT